MFRRSYNRMILKVKITTQAPLLIRAGDAGLDPTASDLVAVRTRHGMVGRTVYIPGSSLRGVVRSTAEALLRSYEDGPQTKVRACNPLDRSSACDRKDGIKGGPKRDERLDDQTAHLYSQHCSCCRTFGSTALKGRIAIRDLFPFRDGNHVTQDEKNLAQANTLEHRHSVALDRLTGAARNGGLFDMEVVPPGVSFWGEITLENFQLWQLGLLVTAFDQFEGGFAQLGSSKGRGFGLVSFQVEDLIHEQIIREGRASGVGILASPKDREAYKLRFTAADEFPPLEGEVRGITRRFVVKQPAPWLDVARKALGEELK